MAMVKLKLDSVWVKRRWPQNVFAVIKGSEESDRYVLLGNHRDAWTYGSTEWVEHNLINLGCKAVAYLNVDCAVQGPGFFVGSTPQLDSLIIEVTKKVFS
ncbi:hypothetical protein GLYMA_17G079500v4 [Glycine max]|uniref:Peptidase M28 domain-containing protein n=2 Tax=Glycine subgen. Soja TaxID=1462606 RepID=A0A0R0FAA7_SOYBN|nr:hypothetical protein GYH30_046601 [Glycine max]KRH03146.1 hypothetical protein GLYMA_17G079500v4 [Glycine max]RZB55829.1 putative glutamate carboxypeptidase PLA3 [Glycine soja]